MENVHSILYLFCYNSFFVVVGDFNRNDSLLENIENIFGLRLKHQNDHESSITIYCRY